jgi:hypothetical protein
MGLKITIHQTTICLFELIENYATVEPGLLYWFINNVLNKAICCQLLRTHKILL